VILDGQNQSFAIGAEGHRKQEVSGFAEQFSFAGVQVPEADRMRSGELGRRQHSSVGAESALNENLSGVLGQKVQPFTAVHVPHGHPFVFL
jgi:hypothetical protein